MTSQPTRNEPHRRAEKFAADRGFALDRFLGYGNDGDVWETSRRSVLKIEQREQSFVRELDCYLRWPPMLDGHFGFLSATGRLRVRRDAEGSC